MKLSLLALVLCIGLLTWNAWLQIQITRISHSTSLPSELKLTKLEIVNDQGETVITASSDKGAGNLNMQGEAAMFSIFNKKGEVMSLRSHGLISIKDNETVFLDSSGLKFITFSGEGKPEACAASLTINSGTGGLQLRDINQGITLSANPKSLASFNDKERKILWTTPNPDDDAALIDVNSKSFSRARCAEGAFLISCQGAEPYLEGYKVHLQVGNPTSLTVNSPTLTIEWGREEPGLEMSGPALIQMMESKNGSSKVDDWKKSLRQTVVTLNQSLRPGYWNDVEVIVSPAKADELAHFKVSIKTDSVSLTHPPDQH